MARRGRPALIVAPSAEERRVLARWARGAGVSGALAARAQMIMAAAEGATRNEIAARLETSAHRVGRWCRRFVDEGLDGLRDGLRPGAEPRIDAALRDRVIACVSAGITSTHAIARACGVSQPTASRLRRELALDPSTAHRLPASLRALDPKEGQLLGLFAADASRVLVVGAEPGRAAAPNEDVLAALRARPRRRAHEARAPSSLKLRRFLRQIVRASAGELHAIGYTPLPPGPAVRRFVAKNERLRWHALATHPSFLRVLAGWSSATRADCVASSESGRAVVWFGLES